jgi:hypothetical protein
MTGVSMPNDIKQNRLEMIVPVANRRILLFHAASTRFGLVSRVELTAVIHLSGKAASAKRKMKLDCHHVVHGIESISAQVIF